MGFTIGIAPERTQSRGALRHSPGERGKTKPLGAALALKAAGTALHRCPEACHLRSDDRTHLTSTQINSAYPPCPAVRPVARQRCTKWRDHWRPRAAEPAGAGTTVRNRGMRGGAARPTPRGRWGRVDGLPEFMLCALRLPAVLQLSKSLTCAVSTCPALGLAIDRALAAEAEVYDAESRLARPGLIESHIRLRTWQGQSGPGCAKTKSDLVVTASGGFQRRPDRTRRTSE